MPTLKEIKQLVTHMESQRDKRLPQWLDIGRLILPSRGLFKGEDRESLRNSKLFNNAAQRALRKAAAGMTQAITPASSQWFRHSYMHRADREVTDANEYVDVVDATLRAVLTFGGFYQGIHNFNKELLGFGCALISCEESLRSVARFECPTCGTYSVALDADKQVDCVARRLYMTPRDMETRFGKDKLCAATKSKLESQPYESIAVYNVVQRRAVRQHGKLDAKQKPIASYWYEESGGEDFLAESGFDEMPFFFTVWEEARGIYGTGPGDEALCDQKGIEGWELRKTVGIEKMIDPPVVAPGAFKSRVKTRAGAINETTGFGSVEGLKALYEVNFGPAIAAVQNEINQIAMRLEDTLMSNVYANMSLETRPAGMTMTEYMDRRRRSAELMGPTISAYEPRILTPIMERVFGMCERWGLFPEPPQGLSDFASLNVSYQSPMAQMLEQGGAVAIQQLLEIALPIIKANPDTAHKLDFDQMVDELAQRTGVPASVIRSDEVAAAIRKQVAEQQAAMQQQQALMQAAQAATQLGNVRTQGTVAGAVMGNDQQQEPMQ